MIAALAALGVFVAVPLTGRLALGRLGLPIPRIAWPSLWVAAGLAIWSVPLLLSLILGVYEPELLGAAAWLVAGAILIRTRGISLRNPHLPKWDFVALIGILAAAALSAAFPDDPFIAHGDIAEYANTAVFMANHGTLAIPYPWQLGVGSPDPLFGPLGHLYLTEPTMTFGFGHLFPAWLAQAWAVIGYQGIVQLNTVFNVFALLAVYGLLKRVAGDRVGAIAIVLLAFNPAQIWIAQQTLSEVLSLLFIWTGLLLLSSYLSRPEPRMAVWGGVLVGVSAMVRIDAFLVFPCLVLGHALWILFRDEIDDRPHVAWKPIYLGAVPVGVAAFAYFAVFSRPYLLTLAPQVAAIGALTLLAVVFLLICRVGLARRWARARLTRGPILAGLLAIAAGVAVYGYFIRPIIPPFDTYNDVLQGGAEVRTRVEDALANLGRYLTPGVVWGAFAGAALAFVAAARRPRSAWLFPLLAITAGFTVLYAWNQSSVPYHFVAIRRFVPVVIPGLALFCALAAAAGLRRLSVAGRRLALWSTVALLILFTGWIGAPTYAVAQRQGAYEALDNFADFVPRDREVLALGDFFDSGAWWLPLYLTFDRPVTPVDITTYEGLTGAAARLRAASSDDPLYVLSAKDAPLAPVEAEVQGTVNLSIPVIDNYAVPVPRTVHTQYSTLTAALATGMNTLGAELVARRQWMVLLNGMYVERQVGDSWVRATNGDGRIVVPIEGDEPPDTLSVDVANSGPGGGPLKILINDVTLFDGDIPPGRWSQDLPIPDSANVRLGETTLIEIVSDTFEPDESLGYNGPIGVELQGLTLERTGS